ncbi:hypothetical protein BG015_001679 [Linnemannia schmuckeri]|uniref:F-box domain-containing protein n=1 Tax=Linnemannia schmuckeri TaxID=64567 RepID=A0A9P5RPI2_9FUNG|nr:hypothetical protein BG015_001679 [Linnemannia schmuckeri]
MGLLNRLQQRTGSGSQAGLSLRPQGLGQSTLLSSRSFNQQRSTMDNAMSIPEIVERILSFLPQQSLRHVASLVCKDWLRLCRPLYTLTFQWTDCPQFTLVPVPLEPSARGSSRRWSLRKSVSTSSTAHTLVRVIPEKAWLLKKLVGLTALKCRLNYKSPITAMTLAPPGDDEGPLTTTTTAASTTTTITTTATTARMVSTQIAHLQDKARADLIEGIRMLTGQGKLTLLQLELSELDDFAGFLQPILSIATTLTCLWLKKIGIQQLPVGQILTLCPHIEELTIGCEFYSSRARLTMVLLDEGDTGHEEQGTHSLPKNLQLKRLHLKDVLIKESAIIAILESAPGLYELRVHGPVIPPPTPPITPSATAQHDFTMPDDPTTVPVGADNSLTHSTATVRGVDLHEEWLTCDRLAFFEDLGVLFPQLTSLHFTRTHHRYTDTMIRGILRAFPNASRWSLAWRDLPDGILRDLNQCVEASSVRQIDSISWAPIQEPLGLYVNHLTSLEILPMTDWTPRWGNALHEFLCESPLLEHLRAGSISYYIENLDLNRLLPGADYIVSNSEPFHNNNKNHNDDHDLASVSTHSNFERRYCDSPPSSKKTLKVWACRNLKTLHLEFSRERPKTQPNSARPVSSYTAATSTSHQSSSTRSVSSSSSSAVMVPLSDNSPRLSRIVYGYISRFCPNLQDLLIRAYRLNMTLRGGFALLTRLRKLKRIAISQYDCHFNERDMLPWIMKRRQSLSGIQALQWKAIAAGWWRVLHAKELGPATSSSLSLPPPVALGETATATPIEGKGKQKEGHDYRYQQDHDLVRPSPPGAAPIEKLGQLSDVVDVLTAIMADRSSATRDLRQEGLTGLVEDCRMSVWPELECVRIVHGQKAKSGIKEGAIRAVLKKHRPEVEFQWVSWINQF